MIDIHAHILPGVDDGPRTPQEALAVLSALASEGVTGVVATPHFNDHYPRLSVAEVQIRLQQLSAMARGAGIEIEMWAGHEIRLSGEIERALAEGMAASINGGPYVLLELPTQEFPIYLPQVIGRLRQLGYIPVIAHAERYRPTWQDPMVLAPLVEMEALMQITAGSLLGFFGRQSRTTAETLLRCNIAHIIASDVHALSVRPPNLTRGLRVAEEIVGSARTRELAFDVPQAVVHGAPVRVPPIVAVGPKRRRLFGLG